MNKHNDNAVEFGLIGALFFALLILFFLELLSPAHAQDNPQPIICRDVGYGYNSFVIRIPPAWNDPSLASWWVLADGFGAYADPTDGVTFRADALTHVDLYGEGNPEWEQNIKVGDVVVGSGDYSTIVTANQSTAECDANDYPVVTPISVTELPPQATAQPVVSTGRVCVAKYLDTQTIIVCS